MASPNELKFHAAAVCLAVALVAVAACSSPGPPVTEHSPSFQQHVSAADAAQIRAAVLSPFARRLAASFLKSSPRRPTISNSDDAHIELAGNPIVVNGVDPNFVRSSDSTHSAKSADMGKATYVAMPIRLNSSAIVDTAQLTIATNGTYSPDAIAAGNEERKVHNQLASDQRLLLFSPTRTWFAWDSSGVKALDSSSNGQITGRHMNPTEFRSWLRRQK